jgi:AcrR family transcriptional regulator
MSTAGGRPTEADAPSPSQLTYHHENLADQLLDAALEIVRTKGAHAVSLREVARRAGVSHMAPYRHFKDKEALLAGVAERGFRKLTAILETAFDDQNAELKFDRAFHFLGEQYVQFVLTNKETAQIMFGGFVDDLKCYPAAHEAGDRAFDQLLRMIRIGQAQGYFDASIDAEGLGVMIWSQVHGFSMLLAENQFGFLDVAQREVFLSEMQKLMTYTFMRGLAPQRDPALR